MLSIGRVGYWLEVFSAFGLEDIAVASCVFGRTGIGAMRGCMLLGLVAGKKVLDSSAV